MTAMESIADVTIAAATEMPRFQNVTPTHPKMATGGTQEDAAHIIADSSKPK